MTYIQDEGWYPDPAGSPRNRYWDGEVWTERFSAPFDGFVSGARAPEGTSASTVWIWVLAISPIVTTASSVAFSLSGADRQVREASVAHPLAAVMSGQFLSLVVNSAIYLLLVLVALRDARELKERGVPRPFGWGWAFFGQIVYVIGRSVIVRRRTGAGLAPLWVFVGALVVTFVVSSVTTLGTVINRFPQ